MTSTRKISLTAGLFYLLTFVSVPTLFLYSAVRGADYIVGSGPDTSVYVGSVLEIIVALAGIGTAVALYPVVKRQNEGVALGFVAVRTLEAGAIFAGVFVLLAVVTLRQAGAGASALATGQTLVGLHDWTFTLSEPLPAVNALLLGYCSTSRAWCRASCPCWDSSERPCSSPPPWPRCSAPTSMAPGCRGSGALPIAVWEFSLGVYLVVRGFRAAGLRQLGLEPVEPVEPATATAPTSELRPAA